MKSSEVDRRLRKKMGLEGFDGGNHTLYRFRSSGTIITPNVLAISRGSGELRLANAKGLARALGMRLDEFREFIGCHLGAELARLAFATMLLDNAFEKYRLFGVVVEDYVSGCRISAKLVISDISRLGKKK